MMYELRPKDKIGSESEGLLGRALRNDTCKGVGEAALDRGKVATKGSAELTGSSRAGKAYQT